MYRKLTFGELFILLSNLFLILPALFAAIYSEWLFCFFAGGLFIFSPLFHWRRITNPSGAYFVIFRLIDWAFATTVFVYMYRYVYHHFIHDVALLFYASLLLVIIFFLYGWRRGDYNMWHPWFHIIASIVSSAILIMAH